MKFSLNLMAAALGLVTVSAQAAPLSAGNLVVARIGNAAAALSSAALPVFLDEFPRPAALFSRRPCPRQRVQASMAAWQALIRFTWLTIRARQAASASSANQLAASGP